MTVHELSRLDARRIAARAQVYVGEAGELAVAEGVKGTWQVDPAPLGQPFSGDRLAGKLDATADRKAGVLRVNAIHQDVPFDTAMTAAVDHEIKDLAHWLGLELMPR